MLDFLFMFVILVLTFIIAVLVFLLLTPPTAPSSSEMLTATEKITSYTRENEEEEEKNEKELQVFYCSQTGKAKKFAFALFQKLNAFMKVSVVNMADYDPEDLFTESALCVFIISTYTDGEPADSGRWFFRWLSEAVNDFRVQKDALAHLKFAVFGNGNTLYHGNYNKAAKEIFSFLRKLSAQHVVPFGEGDEIDNPEESFDEWSNSLEQILRQGIPSNVSIPEVINYESESEVDDDKENEKQDLEDLIPAPNTTKTSSTDISERPAKKEMVTPALRSALTKQGYKIIGSHSGVKLCRWTKSMLRGRGGCYKHTFYGIASHQCMETTPSLACANKCVFCWRHHTNPVGTDWRWKVDPPQVIIQGAMENHRRMIREMKGVPGVLPIRFEEGMKPKHCALSLVGEPIMYPHINEFISMLHEEGISSFLVTNAQFPELIDNLVPVTQLYVSVDAATKESLKTIDRPLFGDFWERFLASLDSLSRKKQRTVYRMTLVKEYNVEAVQEYAALVKRGMPDFIEVKGVTYCGYSGANPLTMDNVPFHSEVINFCHSLLTFSDLAQDYAISCEHEHSCSILIAHKKFLVGGKWHTWIDYNKFQNLVKGSTPFTSLDYMVETPGWAVYGSQEHGFDPKEVRFYRKKGAKEQKIDHGC